MSILGETGLKIKVLHSKISAKLTVLITSTKDIRFIGKKASQSFVFHTQLSQKTILPH